MRKWDCPSSDDLDHYILESKFDEQNEITAHIKKCQYCQLYIAQQTRDYEELENSWQDSSVPDVIYLAAIKDGERTKDTSQTLLAAEGVEKEIHAESLALVSSDSKILMRVVRDQHTKDVWLYLISDDKSLCRNVLIRPFGFEQDFISDERGRINLGQVSWPTSHQLKAEIRLPKASFTLSPLEKPAEADEYVDLKSSSGDHIRLSLLKGDRNYKLKIDIIEIKDLKDESTLRIALRESGKLKALGIEGFDGKIASIDNIKTSEGLEIFLYH